MDRLTSYNEDMGLLINEEEMLLSKKGFVSNDEMYKITRHLAEKLKKYEDLEEQGKLLKLLCAVDNTIYHLCFIDNEEPQIVEMKVCCVEPYGALRKHKGVCEIWNVYAETEYTKAYFNFFDFGKIVFLTQRRS